MSIFTYFSTWDDNHWHLKKAEIFQIEPHIPVHYDRRVLVQIREQDGNFGSSPSFSLTENDIPRPVFSFSVNESLETRPKRVYNTTVLTPSQFQIRHKAPSGGLTKLPSNAAPGVNAGVDDRLCKTNPLKVIELSLVCNRTVEKSMYHV